MKKRALIPHPSDPELILVPLARDKGFAVVNSRHVAEVAEINWHREEHRGGRTVYAASPGGGVRLHRLIGGLLGFDPGLEVDHRNHDGLDCRDENLRPAATADNLTNVGWRSDNTSGIRGVYLSAGKWKTQIGVKGKVIYLGSYDDKELAEFVATEARVHFHGEYASNDRSA